MSKPVLGRGLGRLMQNPASGSDPNPAEQSPVAPGLRILIRGADAQTEIEPAAAESAQAASQTANTAPTRRVVVALLVGADIALVAWPVAWVLNGNIGGLGLAGCAVSVGCAACCGVFAFRVWRGM